MSTCRMRQPRVVRRRLPGGWLTGTRGHGTAPRCHGRPGAPRRPAPAPAGRRRRPGRHRRTNRGPDRRRPGRRAPGRGAARPASISPVTSARVNRRGPPGARYRLAAPDADAGEQPPRLVEPPGQGAVDDRRDRAGGQHAHRATRPQHAGHRGHRRGRGIHVLQDAVAQHQVGALLAGQRGQVGGVALDGAQRHRHLGRAALRRGQRVRARVEHRDRVPGRGQRHREAPGPAASVDDVEPGPAGLRGQFGDHRRSTSRTTGCAHRRTGPSGGPARAAPQAGHPRARPARTPPARTAPARAVPARPPSSLTLLPQCSADQRQSRDTPPGGADRAEPCRPEPCLATNRVDSSGSRRSLQHVHPFPTWISTGARGQNYANMAGPAGYLPLSSELPRRMVIDVQTGLASATQPPRLSPMHEHLELPRPLRLLRCTGLSLSESVGLPLAAYVLGAWLGGRDRRVCWSGPGRSGLPR